MKLNELKYKSRPSYITELGPCRDYIYNGYGFSFIVHIQEWAKIHTRLDCELWKGEPSADPFDDNKISYFKELSTSVKEVFKKIDAGEDKDIPAICDMFNWLKNEAIPSVRDEFLKIAEDMRKVAKSL